MDKDRPRLPANRNCYRLSRVSWALSQISCYILSIFNVEVNDEKLQVRQLHLWLLTALCNFCVVTRRVQSDVT